MNLNLLHLDFSSQVVKQKQFQLSFSFCRLVGMSLISKITDLTFRKQVLDPLTLEIFVTISMCLNSPKEQGEKRVKKLNTHTILGFGRQTLIFKHFLQISNIVSLVTGKKSSKAVVLLTGMVSLIYALANPIIYGKMSTRYRWAYKRVFESLVLCKACGQKSRSWSISFSSRSE